MDAINNAPKTKRPMPMSFGSMPSQIRKKNQKKQRSKSRMKQRNPGASSYSFGAKLSGKPQV